MLRSRPSPFIVMSLSPAAGSWLVIVGLIVMIAALVYAAAVVVPVLLATVLSILLTPVFRYLTYRRVPRVVAAVSLLAATVAAGRGRGSRNRGQLDDAGCRWRPCSARRPGPASSPAWVPSSHASAWHRRDC